MASPEQRHFYPQGERSLGDFDDTDPIARILAVQNSPSRSKEQLNIGLLFAQERGRMRRTIVERDIHVVPEKPVPETQVWSDGIADD